MSDYESVKADLIARGLLVAAERLVPPTNKSVVQPVQETLPILANKTIKIHCAKTSCRNFTIVDRANASRYLCPEHSDTKRQIRYKGNVYTPHAINDEGVAFTLKNGNVVTLPIDKIEWV